MSTTNKQASQDRRTQINNRYSDWCSFYRWSVCSAYYHNKGQLIRVCTEYDLWISWFRSMLTNSLNRSLSQLHYILLSCSALVYYVKQVTSSKSNSIKCLFDSCVSEESKLKWSRLKKEHGIKSVFLCKQLTRVISRKCFNKIHTAIVPCDNRCTTASSVVCWPLFVRCPDLFQMTQYNHKKCTVIPTLCRRLKLRR